MTKSKLSNILIGIQVFLSSFICIFDLIGKKALVSHCFSLTFIFLIILTFNEVSDKKYIIDKNGRDIILIVILTLIFVFFNSKLMIGFEYLKKYIMFVSTLLFFYNVVLVRKVEYFLIKIIYLNFFLISSIYIYFFLRYKSICYIFNGRTSTFLTFGMSNPNKTGLYMLCFAIYAFLLVFIFRKKILKMVCFVILVFYIYFILETDARNALISFFLFIIFMMFMALKKRKIPKIVINLMLYYPFLFAIFYMLIIENRMIQEFFSFFVSEGKKLTSRVSVWKDGFEYFINSPLIGAYYEISSGTGSSQMLNTHLDILFSYGIIIFLMTMRFLRNIIMGISKEKYNFIKNLSLFGFFTCIFSGAGEAALFSGGTGYHILVGSLLLFARYRFN